MLIGLFLVLQNSKVQTWLATKVSEHLSDAIGTTVSIKSVNIHFFDRAQIKGIYIEDLHKDTLLFVDQMDVNFDDIFLGFTHFSFDEVNLRNGQFNVRQIAGENDLNIQFLIDFINGPRDTTNKTHYRPPEIFFWKVNLDNVDFTYEYKRTIPDTPIGFNPDLIRLKDIKGTLKRFMIVDDSLSGELRNMTCFEPNGFRVIRMDADFVISYTMMDFADLLIETPLSSLNGKIHFDYNSYDDLSDFIPKVQMRGKIKESKVNTKELAFFAPELIGLNQYFNLKGTFKGTVDDLSGKGIDLTYGNNTNYSGSFRMKGLPDIDKTKFNFNIRNFTTTAADIEQLPEYPFDQGAPIILPDEVKRLGNIEFNGVLDGLLADFKLNGLISCTPGVLHTNLSVKHIEGSGQYSYNGSFKSEHLNIGKIVGMDDLLGVAVFQADISGEGLSRKTMQTDFRAEINSLAINKYNYQNISVEGSANNDFYTGLLKVADPNLKMEGKLNADFRYRVPAYQFNASLGKAWPNELNLWKTDSSLTLSAVLMAEFSGNTLDDLYGRAEISEGQVSFGKGKYNIDDLLLEASGDRNNRDIELNSNILDMGIHGAFSISHIYPVFCNVLNQALPNRFKVTGIPTLTESQEFASRIKLKDTRVLSALFLPEIGVKEDALINLNFSSNKGRISVDGNFPLLHVGSLNFETLSLGMNMQRNQMAFLAKANALEVMDSLYIRHLETELLGDTLNGKMNLQWASKSNIPIADSRLNFGYALQDKDVFVNVLPSLILIGDTLWQVNEENSVRFEENVISFDNLAFTHLDEFIRIDGRIGAQLSDELDVILDKFNLANINPLLKGSGIRLKGKANGIISLAGLQDDPFFKSNLQFYSISMNDDFLGDGQLSSTWMPTEKRIDLDGALVVGNVPRVSFKGGYYPNKKTNNLDVSVVLNNLKVDIMKGYLKDIFSDILDGYADGKIRLSGSTSELITDGKILLKRTAVNLAFLNTTYSFTHELVLEKNKMYAKNVLLHDQFNNTAILDFVMNHQYFDNLHFDIRLASDRIMALNTTESQSDLFYGTAFASGTFRAYGPIDNLIMDISASTEKGTKFSLPLYDPGEVSTQDFITFEKTGSINKRIRKKSHVLNHTGYELNFNLHISNDADVILIFDPQTGDIIKGKGTADLRMEVSEAGTFSIYGDYTINSGNYQFNLVVSKPFELQPGGTISFKGDPYDADINIAALYKVRTSLYNLVKNIDSSATVKRMIDVNAVMYLTDKLLKPQVKFDIILPNADESTRNLLHSQIVSDDELNRQVFALLMLGSFWPSQGGASEIAGIGGANASELISSQLSSMLGNLSDDLKLGVNYKQGDAAKSEELRLMWSTQLLGDRVLIDGNFGTTGMPQSSVQNTSNLVGEFNIEAKLNADGTIRIKVFNRSNQYLLVYNGVPYTQGVGVFYRRDFDTFSDLKKKK